MSTNIGLLGGGFIGSIHAEAYQQIESAQLTALLEADPEVRNSFHKEFGVPTYASWSEFREADLDALDICLPTYLHREFIEKSLEMGKPIICEKPLALSSSEAEEISTLVEEAGIPFMVGHVLRFWPEYVKMRELIQSGNLGQPETFFAQRLTQRPQWSKWLSDPELSGGAAHDLHIHDLDYTNWLFGSPKSIFGRGVRGETGGLDHVFSLITYEEVEAFVEGTFLVSSGYPFTMRARIGCREGTVEYEYRGATDLQSRAKANSSLILYRKDHDPTMLEVSRKDPYQIELEYFVDQLQKGEKLDRVTVGDGARAVLTAQKSIKSIQEKQPLGFES
ncbi:MAG: Gfo/Idh/MocA family protein [Candidatus Bipolaricaulota bacterium]